MSPVENLRDQTIERFWETIPPLWGTIRSHIRAQATDLFDISDEQFHILRHVRRGMGSVSELATAKKISRPAISQGVEVLVKKGLLSRVQDTQDRRRINFTLTKAGNDVLDTVFKKTRGWMKERMSGLTNEELNNVMKAMNTLRKMLEEK